MILSTHASSAHASFLGLDLGTSGLKAVLLGEDGTVLAHAGVSYPTRREGAGMAEQNPGHWREAVVRAVNDVLSQVNPGTGVAAVGLSAMLPTLVLADDVMEPVRPAITWQDARAEPHGEQLRRLVGGEQFYQVSGQWLDGRYLLSMYLGAQARGDVPATTRHLLGAKDWLLAWLTGTVATDPSTAAGYGAYRLTDGEWHEPVLEATAGLAGGALPELPDVVPSATSFPLRSEAARLLGLPAGLPVCVGAADSVLGAYGLGARDVGDVAYVAGTSTVILGIADAWQPDPHHRYLGTPLAGTPGVGYEMDLLATGSAIRWLAALLNQPDEAELLRLGHDVPPEEAPVFLPYLAPGEQGALWDHRLRGAITGLELRDGPGSLARGLLTGIILESRRCLATLEERGLVGAVRVAGGSGTDPVFRADLADACGRPVGTPDDSATDYSAAGAARLAATTVGAAVATVAEPVHQSLPRAERAAMWERLADRHDRTRLQLTTTEVEQELT